MGTVVKTAGEWIIKKLATGVLIGAGEAAGNRATQAMLPMNQRNQQETSRSNNWIF